MVITRISRGNGREQFCLSCIRSVFERATGYDAETLWQALVHGANNEGPQATGRRGVEYYNRLGYVPNNVKISENVARSLEYAYDDYAIYAFGKALGKPAIETDVYKKRAMNYKKLFDPQTLLMRPKTKMVVFMLLSILTHGEALLLKGIAGIIPGACSRILKA
ncbi:glycoside hydrolase family 92 protein [Niabella defluvii]|nr:glycoside hydrolase family 92 protein [Niabella sp. I65]